MNHNTVKCSRGFCFTIKNNLDAIRFQTMESCVGENMFVLLFFLCILVSSSVSATDYYVAQNSPNASDSNDGKSENSPFLTIQAAADVSQAGDNVLVKAGTYRETVIPANSGSSSSPITFKPYGNDKVIITGTELVTGWTQHSDNIYKASLPKNFVEYDQGHSDQIFVNGQMMLVARWPNTSLNLSYPKKAYTTDAHKSGSGPYTGVLTCKTNPPAIDPTGCKIFFQPDTGKWSWSFSGRVQSISGNQLVFLSENGSTEDDKTDYADVCRYYIYDDLELLDQEGEWYHDQEDGILYLWVPGGGNPSTKKVEARKRVFAFDLSDRKYILIRGFELFGATITTDRVAGIARGAFDEDGFNSFPWPWRDDGSYGSSQHITIDSLTVLYPWHSMKMEYHFFMQYGLQSGIVLGGTDHIVQNCIIRYSSDNAISCNGYRHKIYNNLIEDIDYNGRGYSAVGCKRSSKV